VAQRLGRQRRSEQRLVRVHRRRPCASVSASRAQFREHNSTANNVCRDNSRQAGDMHREWRRHAEQINEVLFNYDLSIGMRLESSLKDAMGQGD
jgi:hypothetical protein